MLVELTTYIIKIININMSFTPNNYLKNDTETYLRDQQHAARLFVDDQFRLAPKQKFLFHVAFSINPAACKDTSLYQRHKNEINMLVKNVDLPSFEIQNELVNQYNRKKAIQYQHKVGAITLTFHDDNMGVINKVWQNYYTYYYADSKSASVRGAYNRTATRNSNFITSSYGLDNGSTTPFFNYITIYQMARHEFISYKLINPIITSWNHNKLDYSQGNTPHDFTMKIQCEAIAYGSGEVNSNSVEGFGVEHYDSTPSTLSGEANSTSYSPSFKETNNLDASSLNTIIQQVNTYQNTKSLNIDGKSGIINKLSKNTIQNVNGIQGIAFPRPSTDNTTVVATPINLGIK